MKVKVKESLSEMCKSLVQNCIPFHYCDHTISIRDPRIADFDYGMTKYFGKEIELDNINKFENWQFSPYMYDVLDQPLTITDTKELTDEEIVGEGYIRYAGIYAVDGLECKNKFLITNEWCLSSKQKGQVITTSDYNNFYYRIKKPVELTDTERHEILLDNVGAGKCWVKFSGGAITNSWFDTYNFNKRIKLPNTTEFVEITDEILIQLRDGVK